MNTPATNHQVREPGHASVIRALLREPYRLLFPLGLALGMIGLLLWPAFVYGWRQGYPAVLHARMMIEGFVFCFVTGFLGTAMPHMLEVRPWPRGVTAVFAGLILLNQGLHAAALHAAGDGVFALTLLWMCALLGSRFPHRRDLPPPGFSLVAMGMLCGITGALMLAMGRGLFLHSLGKLFLYQGFVLLPILGIGSFLLPRMLGLENRQLVPTSRLPSSKWKQRAGEHTGFGLLILISFALEASGRFLAGAGLRALAFAGAFLLQVPLWKMGERRGSIARWLPIPFLSIPLGYLGMAMFPNQRLDLLHLVMISGYALLCLLVATRVTLGHGGGGAKLYLRQRGINWLGGLTLLAVATRISAPWLRRGPLSHYAYASLTLTAVFALWLWLFFSYLKSPTSGEGS